MPGTSEDKPFTEKMTEGVKDAASKVGEKVQEGYEKVKETIKNATTSTKDKK